MTAAAEESRQEERREGKRQGKEVHCKAISLASQAGVHLRSSLECRSCISLPIVNGYLWSLDPGISEHIGCKSEFISHSMIVEAPFSKQHGSNPERDSRYLFW